MYRGKAFRNLFGGKRGSSMRLIVRRRILGRGTRSNALRGRASSLNVFGSQCPSMFTTWSHSKEGLFRKSSLNVFGLGVHDSHV